MATQTKNRDDKVLVIQNFAENMLDWYDSHRRSLPWRTEPGKPSDPYHVWLSEIMLQQTTVPAVKSYYRKFLGLWPTVQALAEAPLDDVLKEWAGLGYYARARNLHKCATVVASEYEGTFPTTEAGLRTLPGIGDYTAAAIAAIAFGEPAAVVDGNIERIITRVFRISTPLPAAKKLVKEHMQLLTPTKRPGDFAQSLMDLGASHCSPKKPSCMFCPLVSLCAAHKAGDMETYPVKPPKKVKPTRRAISYWLVHDGHVLLERRAAKGLLGGMPGFFSTPWEERDDFPRKDEWLKHAPTEDYWKPASGMTKHTFTHFHLETQMVIAKASQRYNLENAFWHPVKDLENAGLPTVFAKMVKVALST